eukprot:TRINITY_DN2915_c0_g1_i1.p1 TRINITY_DN2915_c0_g1~~TRINITY_DN2915_c0_g1_i1.p1  ORF type:complete len:176 (-),score=74.45 TRINITY_DN2915_c0_g1_i1:926-1432(-)
MSSSSSSSNVDDEMRKQREAIQSLLRETFDVFDHDRNGTCDVREIGTIVRALDKTPSETEIARIISECEDDESSGFIRYEKFEQVMLPIMMDDDEMKKDSEERILQAFKVLDEENKGYLTKEELTTLLTTQGEVFSISVIQEMLSSCLDSEKQVCHYEDYAAVLASSQ